MVVLCLVAALSAGGDVRRGLRSSAERALQVRW